MKKIWIDLDNSPHVPLFRPIIKELENRGHRVITTARDYAQTKKLLDYWNLDYKLIGEHGGKNRIKKLFNLFKRTSQLINYINNFNVDLALSHGSRTQLTASKLLRIPSLVMMDYEHTEHFIFNNLSNWLLWPIYVPDSRLQDSGIKTEKVLRYKGFKEELYLNNFKPDLNFRRNLSIPLNKILVTIRPPALLGNYHDERSNKIVLELLNKIIENSSTFPLIVHRTKEDKILIQDNFGDKVHFLDRTVEGLQLIWNSDLFISGGGTMNREAALLDVPAYSIFTGKKPYLDEYLSNQGKLIFIDKLDKIDKVKLKKRNIEDEYISNNNYLAKNITDKILKLIK